MRSLMPPRRIIILLIALRNRNVAASPDYMNSLWPPAHYLWVAPSNAVMDQTAQEQLGNTNSSDFFCRDREPPQGAERMPFPIAGGALQFHLVESDSAKWTVNVVFDNFQSLVKNQSGISRPESSWIWNNSLLGDGSYCSSGLGIIREVLLDRNNSTGTAKQKIAELSLHGLNATLGVEMVRHRSNLDGHDTNIVTVLRQCTFIRFTSNDDLKSVGPCGINLSSLTPTVASISSSEADDRSSEDFHHHFELWMTFVIVFGVAVLVAAVAFLLLQRKRRRHTNAAEDQEAPVYDAAAARMRQQQPFESAPDYTAANGGVSLPTYDEATRQSRV
ncbi:hypothetical protein ED733_008821 [Metarhizium rileyi]|uniref:Uncharacterized protein n=1 Tax=Metarhizium rileyi (strain RCEF 4871) TaxID=1649241 RepID=A0A5C6GQC3_METRR|nr:hypothetical protein ED733_008821 [Metarhizium rileyi]